MISVNNSFLQGYAYALALVQKGLKDMHEYDFDDKTLDMCDIYVEGLKVSADIHVDSQDGGKA